MFWFWSNPFLLSLATLTILFFLWNISSLSNKRTSPPSPPKFPLVGNLHQLGSLPHRSLRALAEQHGPLMLLHFGHVPTIVVSSAEIAQEVMKTHDLVFASRPRSSMADKLMYGSRDIAFSPYGEYWRQVRRISVLHLFTVKQMQSFESVREEEIAIMVEKIHASRGVVDLSDMLMSLTNDIICRVALGRKYSRDKDRSNRFREVLRVFSALLGSFPVGDFVPWLGWIDRLSGLDARAKMTTIELDHFLEEVLEDRIQAKQHLETSCFIDVLLSLDEDTAAGSSLNRDSMKAIVLDMFSAGTETTFAALEWTMAELIKHPGALKQVQEEVRRVAGPKETVKLQDTNQMNFMKAAIKEALRLHPPGPLLVPRESTQNCQLYGYEIPAGTRVIINAWAIGRDPRSWDRPEEYWPERFLNNSGLDFKGQHFQFIPFGAGRRVCPGIPFAIPTIELALANLLYHFNWEMPNRTKGEELDMMEMSGISIRKKCSLALVARPKFL